MNLDLLAMQLYAMRAQLDSLIFMVDQERLPPPVPEAPVDPNACPSCLAPEDRQAVSSTLDGKRTVTCLSCGLEREV